MPREPVVGLPVEVTLRRNTALAGCLYILCAPLGSVDPDSISCANTQATPSSQPRVFALIHMEQPVFSCALEDAIFNTSTNCLFIKGAGQSTPLWLPWFCDAVAAFLKYKLF